MGMIRGYTGGTGAGRRFSLLITLASLLLTGVIAQQVYFSFRGPDEAGRRLAERKSYYQEVVVKSGLVGRPADFWEVAR
jgi:hypothetical protein